MPYIDYDENGNITGQFACQQYENQLYFDIPDDGKIYKYNEATQTFIIDSMKEFQKSIQYLFNNFQHLYKGL